MNFLQRISSLIESLSHEKKVRIGLGLVVASALSFSYSNLLVKQITEEFSQFTVIFWRGWVGLFIILLFARFNLKKLLGKNRPVLLLRGLAGTLALTAFFSSIKFTSLSNTVGLFNTYPVFTTLFGVLFFKEHWRNIYLFALLCSVGGVWLIVRPDLGIVSLGELLSLTGAFFAAWVINLIRYLRKSDSVLSIIFYFLMCTSVFSIITAGSQEIVMSFSFWFNMFLVGFLTTSAQLLMTAGYSYCSAAGGSIISMLGIPFTLLLSKIFLGEKLDLFLGVGVLLIFISGYLIAFSKRKMPR